MTNRYKVHLNSFFEIITDFQHTFNRLNKVLLKDVEKYTSEEAKYFSGTVLVTSDWTGPTDNGWTLKFPAGTSKVTLKDNYGTEITKVLSRQFGLAYAQSFEAFETLLKDLVNVKIISDQTFKGSLPISENYSREKLRGGEYIFKLIKKAGGKRFKKYSKKNNHNYRFSEIFKVLLEVRHAITHSQGILKTSKIPSSDYYKAVFEYLLPLNKFEGELIKIKFEYKTLERLLIFMSEFAYQLFKILSEEDGYEWKI